MLMHQFYRIIINMLTGGWEVAATREKQQQPGDTARRIGDALDLPAQLLPGFCHLELWQNRQAVIEGVRGVLSYSESEIQLNLSSLVVTFRGADLNIRSYQGEQLTMAGMIAEIHFTT